MDIKEFAKNHSFEELSSNIYYRIHSVICVDVLEVIRRDKYFTVNLYLYCLNGFGLYPVIFNNLGRFKNPLFKNYWWEVENQEEVIEFLEKAERNFWSKYLDLEVVRENVKFCINHSAFREENNEEDLVIFLDSVQENPQESGLIQDVSKILQWIKMNTGGERFPERAASCNGRGSLYTMNYYYEDEEEDDNV